MTEEPDAITDRDTERLDRELAEREFELLLAEATSASHGPPADLEARTLAVLRNAGSASEPAIAPTSGSATACRPHLLAAAAAMLGIGVVMAVAFAQGHDEDRSPAVAPQGPEPSSQSPKMPAPQAQDPDRPAAELIRELAKPDVRAAAQRDLRRLGSQAIPAIRQALGDAKAPRAELFALLEAMEATAAPLASDLAEFVTNLPKRDPLLGPAFRLAATIAPFASAEDQQAMERVVLRTSFLVDGPAAGPGAGAGGGPGVAVGGKPLPRPYSMRDVARLLHRMRLGPASPTTDLVAGLASDSPFERELAARLLRTDDSPATITALQEAVLAEHPKRVDVEWDLDDMASGTFGFRQDYDHEIRIAAARSLVRVAGSTTAAAGSHALLLQFGTSAEQRRSAGAIGRLSIAPADREAAVQAVVTALKSDDEIVLRECIAAVSTLDIRSPEARAALLALASRKGSRIAKLAQSTLRALDR
ncbi:MAG: hypothetical protein NXI31_27065 [bacterium]|nr:hypothetical protein [bacterium]